MTGSAAILFLNGFVISLGLVVAVGPQNIYVLRKGLMHRHVLAVAGACFLIDAVLLVTGAFGVGLLVAGSATLAAVTAWAGALFLIGYGILNFRDALHPRVIGADDIAGIGRDARGKGLGAAVTMALALSLLNPHLYFDTLVVIGSIAARYEGVDRVAFTLGTVAASAFWFFGLGFGARLLAPWFSKPYAWRLLDTASGLIMIGVAAMLIWGQVGG